MCLLSVMSFMYGYARTSDTACWVDRWLVWEWVGLLLIMTARNEILCPSYGRELSPIYSVCVAICKIVSCLGMLRRRAGTLGLLLPFTDKPLLQTGKDVQNNLVPSCRCLGTFAPNDAAVTAVPSYLPLCFLPNGRTTTSTARLSRPRTRWQVSFTSAQSFNYSVSIAQHS